MISKAKEKAHQNEINRIAEVKRLKLETVAQCIAREDSCLRAENQMRPIKPQKEYRGAHFKKSRFEIKANHRQKKVERLMVSKHQSKALDNLVRRWDIQISGKDYNGLASQFIF